MADHLILGIQKHSKVPGLMRGEDFQYLVVKHGNPGEGLVVCKVITHGDLDDRTLLIGSPAGQRGPHLLGPGELRHENPNIGRVPYSTRAFGSRMYVS